MMSDKNTQNGSGEKVADENMKKHNEDDVNYCIMSKLRQHFDKLGNYRLH